MEEIMKIKTAVVALFFVSNAVAAEQGFYIGGKFGGESITSDETYQDNHFDGVGNDGLQYGLLAGYTMPLSSGMYIGIEVEYIHHSTKYKSKIGSYTSEIKFKNEYGGSLILGHGFSDNVNIYGRVGATRMKAEGRNSTGFSGDDTVTGVLGGVGVELKNNSPLSLRAEYRYTSYGDIKFSNGGGANNSSAAHVFAISCLYKF